MSPGVSRRSPWTPSRCCTRCRDSAAAGGGTIAARPRRHAYETTGSLERNHMSARLQCGALTRHVTFARNSTADSRITPSTARVVLPPANTIFCNMIFFSVLLGRTKSYMYKVSIRSIRPTRRYVFRIHAFRAPRANMRARAVRRMRVSYAGPRWTS